MQIIDNKGDAVLTEAQLENLKTSGQLVPGKMYHTTDGGSETIDVIDNLESESAADALSANQGRVLNEKIEDMQLFKFPNAVIIGEPTINNGQVSGFSTANYLQFPFILDVQNRPFQVDFAFTTGSNVTTQQNILDSKFGIALAIKNSKGLMAISTNGTSWTSSVEGTQTIQPNTTYYARLSWNRLVYKTQLSTNGRDYVDDMSVTVAAKPYPETIFIGGGSVEALGHASTPFFGSINMNKAFLTIDGQVIWQGMDDAGLATRADVSLSNLDSAGEQKIKDLVGDGFVKTQENYDSIGYNQFLGANLQHDTTNPDTGLGKTSRVVTNFLDTGTPAMVFDNKTEALTQSTIITTGGINSNLTKGNIEAANGMSITFGENVESPQALLTASKTVNGVERNANVGAMVDEELGGVVAAMAIQSGEIYNNVVVSEQGIEVAGTSFKFNGEDVATKADIENAITTVLTTEV